MNVMMVYGGFFLFSKHAAVSVFSMSPASGVLLGVMCLAIPLLGNLYPRRISFLMAMRYYAGNWPFGVWLFKGESYRKLSLQRERHPEVILEHAVKGMLPKNRIAAKMLTKLHVFAGPKHTHEAQTPTKTTVHTDH